MTRTEESSLIKKALKGSQSAFSELYETYRPNVIGVVKRRAHDPDVVDDLIQQTFIRAFRSLPQFRGDAAFGTWITRIAINVCLSHCRSEKIRKDWMELLEDLEYAKAAIVDPSRSENPEDVLQRSERRDIVIREIDKLPERYREVMRLRYIKDWSYEEITHALQVPMGTVKTWLNRARHQLSRDFRRLGPQGI
jgi:RNA polymerase sigma-70 factor (ECF subfamily)